MNSFLYELSKSVPLHEETEQKYDIKENKSLQWKRS